MGTAALALPGLLLLLPLLPGCVLIAMHSLPSWMMQW
jgi:hypothetical protein